ncbi:myb/sant-like dna-binding domain [Holotrichia oblita]|uniref:Myb/sant-like dna-binding domain n=1 Tax=Holotrichia oblita TaxID=644536 RepID=A0ACB9SK43_HOLOL|nr:myb/sant-like dna-binding domain [Holotrichia oblita]
MNKKFARSTNFSFKEEHLLISLVKKYKNDVECKRSDTNTSQIKKQEWKKIEEEFNASSGEIYRSVEVLRNKNCTGGGPSEGIIISGVEKDIEDILGTQLTGLPSEFDNDVSQPIIISNILNQDLEVCEAAISSNCE